MYLLGYVLLLLVYIGLKMSEYCCVYVYCVFLFLFKVYLEWKGYFLVLYGFFVWKGKRSRVIL